MVERSDELPEVAWREITVAEGTQGPRTYMFSAQRVRVTKSRVTKRRKPGEELWAIFRRNLDGSEPRYYLSNAPVPVQRPGGHTLGHAGLRGRVAVAH